MPIYIGPPPQEVMLRRLRNWGVALLLVTFFLGGASLGGLAWRWGYEAGLAARGTR